MWGRCGRPSRPFAPFSMRFRTISQTFDKLAHLSRNKSHTPYYDRNLPKMCSFWTRQTCTRVVNNSVRRVSPAPAPLSASDTFLHHPFYFSNSCTAASLPVPVPAVQRHLPLPRARVEPPGRALEAGAVAPEPAPLSTSYSPPAPLTGAPAAR